MWVRNVSAASNAPVAGAEKRGVFLMQQEVDGGYSVAGTAFVPVPLNLGFSQF